MISGTLGSISDSETTVTFYSAAATRRTDSSFVSHLHGDWSCDWGDEQTVAT
jgi:hypothetical protein